MDVIGYPGFAKCTTYIGCALTFNICSEECLQGLKDEILIQCGEDAYPIYEERVEIPANTCFCQVF